MSRDSSTAPRPLPLQGREASGIAYPSAMSKAMHPLARNPERSFDHLNAPALSTRDPDLRRLLHQHEALPIGVSHAVDQIYFDDPGLKLH